MTQVLLATADNLVGRLTGVLAKVSSTTNVAVAGLPSIDGYQTLDGDTVLLTGQTTASQNGPWVVDVGAWARPPGFASGSAVTGGTVVVTGGAARAGTVWTLTTTGTVTVDVTSQTWVNAPVAGLAALLAAKADAAATTAALAGKEPTIAPGTFVQVATPAITGNLDTPDGIAIGSGTHGQMGTGDTASMAFGRNALKLNQFTGVAQAGERNLAIGPLALENCTTGRYNVAVGCTALRALTTGVSNTAFGIQALAAMTTGFSNTAVGGGALEFLTTGQFCTAVGSDALQFNTTGSQNVAMGTTTMENSTTGLGNTAIGTFAMKDCGAASYNVALGLSALMLGTANDNVAIGVLALTSPAGVLANATTTGEKNIAIGLETGQNSTTQRSRAIAIGYRALIGGDGAVAIGATSLAGGARAVAIGDGASAGAANAVALGYGASAGAAGAVAIGRSSAGVAASTSTADEILIGTTTHTVRIPGTVEALRLKLDDAALIANGIQAQIYYNSLTSSINVRNWAGSDWMTLETGALITRGNASIVGVLSHFGTTCGFNNTTPVGKQTLGAAATDLASVIVLANNIRAALIANGLGQN